ncbi:MAG: translation initiation factor IF-2 [Lachnospiraceae bacterium]|nr:translation initiation factor IF-2 [Lachnospiraceae bacterium]
MAKMRIFEIAKSIGVKSSELVKELNENGFEVKSHNSNIEDDAIAFVLKKYAYLKNKGESAAKEETKTEVKKADTKPAEEKTVETKTAEVKSDHAKVAEEKDAKAKVEKKPEPRRMEGPIIIKKASENKLDNNNNNQRNNGRNRNDDRRGGFNNNRNDDRRTNNRNDDRRGGFNNNRNDDRRGGFTNNRSDDRRGGFNNNRNDDRRGGFNNNRNDDRRGGFNNNRSDDRRGGGFGFDKGSIPFAGKETSRKNDYGNKGSRNNRNKNNRKYEEKEMKPKKDPNRKGAFQMPAPVEKPADDGIKTIVIPEVLTIRELADHMKIAAAALVKKLFLQGKMVSINQDISFEEAEEIALEFNCIAELEEKVDVIEELLKEDEEDEKDLVTRPPVICVMGHVDHGKTSLLDAIRETHVTDREAGGITQHIGAYTVKINNQKITFLDTPGHEAFTSMRMRGAKSTDIAVLVVAADDGVMPQTVEAINHAKAAGVEIIVAVNKIDKVGANIERVKQELSEHELIPEDWGGSTVFVPVSAKTGEGLTQLLEMILLTAEVCELKANPNRKARGIVIEAQLDKGRGSVATILVQKGTLHVGDNIVIGSSFGKVRAMIDDKGRQVKEATPSTPVEILGLNAVPDAGEVFLVTDSEKEARNIAEAYITQSKEKLLAETKAKLSLDGLFSQIQAGNIKELNLIVKADVQGSAEAVKQSLTKLSNEEVAIRVIHSGVGAINESDVTLASASNAIIIGFNVRPDAMAKETAERESVDVKLYNVIYNAIQDVEAAMKGMLDPVYEEKVIGHAEIRQTFKASGIGTIAGSYVLDGKIVRGCKVRITREGEQIFEGDLASLKRFKDDVKEVSSGYECGLVFDGFNDINELDQVEAYVMEEVPR